MFDKIKKVSDYISLGGSVLFFISLFFNSWKFTAIVLFIFVMAVNTSTYMEMQRKTNPLQGVTDMVGNIGDLLKGQE